LLLLASFKNSLKLLLEKKHLHPDTLEQVIKSCYFKSEKGTRQNTQEKALEMGLLWLKEKGYPK
jgi:hypothetical protein